MNTDILIQETGDGGDFVLSDNDLVMTSDLSNQIYLALFGGNIISDNGEQSNEYWGNALVQEENKYVSNFERALSEYAMNSFGIQKMQEAADSDLQFLKKYVNYKLELQILTKDSLSLYIDIKAPNNIDEKIRIIWNTSTKTVTSWQ